MTDRNDQQLAKLHHRLLHGKLPSTLKWTEVVELIQHLGRVEPQGRNDEYAFIVGGHREVFHQPHTHGELSAFAVSQLRKFLKAAGREALVPEENAECRMVATIDHNEAHIWKQNGDRLHDAVAVKAYDPFGFHAHVMHRKQAPSTGSSFPAESSFYEEIAKSLTPASDVVLIGEQAESPRAADALLEYLKTRHRVLASRVLVVATSGLSSLDEVDIEKIAKQYMLTAA